MKAKIHSRKLLWNLSYNKTKEVIALITSVGLVVASLLCALFVIQNAELRDGILLSDPLHPFFPPPIDFSAGIFAATHSAIFISVFICIRESIGRFTFAATCYAVLTFLRSLSITLVPLDPPMDMILLVDPIFNFFQPDQFSATKDLFFSGHCSTLFMFYLVAEKKWFKWFLLFLNVFVAIAILWQRVHYTIDVIGGILVAWLVVKGVRILMGRLGILKI
ncbi:MAG: membrane-associated phospholipid phosphatase [Paraglaciecola sp.]|jgi:membrane-associated phospholipid phosphatase